jgi:hypothetical protein
MPADDGHSAGTRFAWVHSSRLHVVMYGMLLIATPFLLLRNFLVEAIVALSGTTFEPVGVTLPVVPVAAFAVLAGLFICLRSHITRPRIVAGVIFVLWIALAQQITDYYFDHKFYDLQQNWHYIAYGIFAFIVYRDLAPRGISMARFLLITYVVAFSLSTFDEAFQMHMSSRVFDTSDIAKDVWGVLGAMILIYVGGNESSALLADCKQVRQKRLRSYFRHPVSLLVLLMLLTVLMLTFSSLLSDFEHWPLVIVFTFGGFVILFAIFHVSQHKWVGLGLALLLAVAVAVQSYFFVRHRSEHITHNQYGLTVYKGIPIPFFDVMFFSDGSFRLVDKKHFFTLRDRKFFFKQEPDILLIGSGSHGHGGIGLLQTDEGFIYNTFTQRGTQVIILKTREACEFFNRLKREHKNVLFILHNTC